MSDSDSRRQNELDSVLVGVLAGRARHKVGHNSRTRAPLGLNPGLQERTEQSLASVRRRSAIRAGSKIVFKRDFLCILAARELVPALLPANRPRRARKFSSVSHESYRLRANQFRAANTGSESAHRETKSSSRPWSGAVPALMTTAASVRACGHAAQVARRLAARLSWSRERYSQAYTRTRQAHNTGRLGTATTYTPSDGGLRSPGRRWTQKPGAHRRHRVCSGLLRRSVGR